MTLESASPTVAPTSTARPLFQWDRILDPGWPFVLAGLALLVAGIIIPAQRELHDLRNEWRKVEAEEARMYGRLQAYDQFLSELRSGDPDLVRRLASAQLNRVPEGEQPLLLTPGVNHTVAQWIDESVPTPVITPEPYPDTLLSRLATGPNRLWLLASSVFLLFVGLLLAPENGARRTRANRFESDDQPVPATGAAAATACAVGTASGSRIVDTEEGLEPLAESRSILVLDESVETDDDDDIIDVELVGVATESAGSAVAWEDALQADDDAEASIASMDVKLPVLVDEHATSPSDSHATPSHSARVASAYDDRVIGPDTERIELARHGAD